MINVASFGAVQFSLGVTLPPSSLIAAVTAEWTSRQESEGSHSSEGDDEGEGLEGGVESGRIMPSAWR